MYKLIGRLSEDRRLAHLHYLQNVDWKQSKGEVRDYFAHVIDGERLYVKIRPGGRVHPHSDSGMKKHYVIQSGGAVSWINGEAFRLEQGGIYEMDSSLEHESFNEGLIDRIHYIELGDGPDDTPHG